jgi:hypothetical protein
MANSTAERQKHTANSLFWKILPVSRLFARFCGDTGYLDRVSITKSIIYGILSKKIMKGMQRSDEREPFTGGCSLSTGLRR